MSLFNFHESLTATLRSGNLPWLAVYGALAVVGAKLQKVMRKTKDFVLFFVEMGSWLSSYSMARVTVVTIDILTFVYRKTFR